MVPLPDPDVDIRLLPADGRGAIAANGFSLLGRAGESTPFLAVLPGVDQPHYIELADAGEAVLMRDSKHPDDGHLAIGRHQLAELIAGAKAGGLDHLA